MPRKIKVAPIQMDAAPAPLENRLNRASDLVAEAAASGAQLVVLPELFNTGYEYDDRNYELAEPIDGETIRWMKAQAAQHGVHLAGSLLLLDEEDVYNALFLVAPDGRLWRYDKNYPFLWERAYFREGRSITIADTDLGRLGMLVCWDSAHADLWARYAGKVNAMIVVSCPPQLPRADLVFPDGLRVNTADLGKLWEGSYDVAELVFGPDMEAHAAWMKVPVVHAVGSGAFRTRMPMPAVSVGAYIASRPDLWERMAQASDVWLEAVYDVPSKVIDAEGRSVACVTSPGDGVTLAEVTFPDRLPQPVGLQPVIHAPAPLRLMIDAVGANLLTMLYRAGVRREWGTRMAPIDPRTRMWAGAMAVTGIAAAAAGWLVGRVSRR